MGSNVYRFLAQLGWLMLLNEASLAIEAVCRALPGGQALSGRFAQGSSAVGPYTWGTVEPIGRR